MHRFLDQGRLAAYRKREDVWQLAEAIKHKSDDSKSYIGAQDAKGSNADKVAEELLLLDRKPSVEDDWRQ